MAFTDTTPRTIVEGWGKVRVLLAAAASCGDLLAMVSDTVVLADSDADRYALYVAGEDGASGDTITAYRGALMKDGTEPPTTAGVGFAIATTEYGDPLYLSDTPGDMGTTPGLNMQKVGWIQSRTEIVVHPEVPRVVCIALHVALCGAAGAPANIAVYSPVAGTVQAVQFINECAAAFTTSADIMCKGYSTAVAVSGTLADGEAKRVAVTTKTYSLLAAGSTLTWHFGGGAGTQEQGVIIEILQA